MFWADFQEQVHEFLEGLRLARHDESYYVHEEAGLGVAVEHYREDPFLCDGQDLLSRGRTRRREGIGAYHGLNLLLIRALLKSLLELILRGNIGSVVLVDLFTPAVSFRAPKNARWCVPDCMSSLEMLP